MAGAIRAPGTRREEQRHMTAHARWKLCAAAIAVVGFALVLAPSQLGGPATYLITSGSSMHPQLQPGDLVVVRERSAYEIGDVVAYRSPLLESTVLHRIVARNGDRFVLKGDDNEFVDPEEPTNSELLGRLWVRVPGVGRPILWTRGRFGFAALAAGLVVASAAATTRPTVRRRRRRAEGKDMTPRHHPVTFDRRSMATALAVVAIACVALSAGASLWPAPPPVRPAFTHRGVFDYSALTPPNAVYDDGSVETGEPVFLSLVDDVDMRFAYRFAAAFPHAVTGTARMDVVVAGAHGWSSTIGLHAPVAFRGDTAEVTATVDLAQMRRRIDRVERLTGTSGGTYTVTVKPAVRVRGTLAGRDLDTVFAPEIAFELDATSLRLRPVPMNGEAGDVDVGDAFRLTQTGSVAATAGTDLDLGARSQAPLALRLGLVMLGLLAAVAAGATWWSVRHAPPGGRPFPRRHAHAVIDVDEVRPAPSRTVVDIASLEALLRLAERYDRLVLRQHTPDGEVYVVEDDGTVYRHEATEQRAASGPADEPGTPALRLLGPADLPDTEDPDVRQSGATAAPERLDLLHGGGDSKKVLYERAKDLGIPGRSRMTKNELVKAVANHHA